MYFPSSYSLAQLCRMCVLLEANFISGKLNIHEEWKCYTTFLWYLLKPLNNILFCLHARANTHAHTLRYAHVYPYSPIFPYILNACAHSLLYITFYAHRIYRSHNSTASKQNNRERRNKKENKLKKCIHSHVSAKYSLRFFYVAVCIFASWRHHVKQG